MACKSVGSVWCRCSLESESDAGNLPIHQVGIVAMGLWLIDAAQFDDLLPHCERLNRWTFMFVLAPLHFPGVTGSPITPLGVL